MTETDRAWQPTLPGLTLPGSGQSVPLEDAALATIAALDRAGALQDTDALTIQLVLELSRAVGAGVRNGRASAAAMAAKELRELIGMLPKVTGGDEGGAWGELVAGLADAGDA